MEEESVDEIIAKNPPDLSRALKARDQQWRQKVEDALDDNYIQSKDILENHANSAKPIQQLIKACQALEVVDVTQSSFVTDGQVRGCVQSLEDFVSKFKDILGM